MRAELVTRILTKVTPAGNWKGFPASFKGLRNHQCCSLFKNQLKRTIQANIILLQNLIHNSFFSFLFLSFFHSFFPYFFSVLMSPLQNEDNDCDLDIFLSSWTNFNYVSLLIIIGIFLNFDCVVQLRYRNYLIVTNWNTSVKHLPLIESIVIVQTGLHVLQSIQYSKHVNEFPKSQKIPLWYEIFPSFWVTESFYFLAKPSNGILCKMHEAF